MTSDQHDNNKVSTQDNGDTVLDILLHLEEQESFVRDYPVTY